MAQEEQVLAIKRDVLEQAGMFQGITFDVDRYLRAIFVPGVPRFIARSQAEHDPSHKQLIPYVLMTCHGEFLSYVRGRRAGETRLVGHRSVGIGGHINPVDDMPLFNTDFREAYLTAVEREVAEEVNVDTTHSDSIVALLNDDSNDVGQVHLGIVHVWTLDAPTVCRREQMITQMAFMPPSRLGEVRDSLETWSSLCVDNLSEIQHRAEAKRGREGVGACSVPNSPVGGTGLSGSM